MPKSKSLTSLFAQLLFIKEWQERFAHIAPLPSLFTKECPWAFQSGCVWQKSDGSDSVFFASKLLFCSQKMCESLKKRAKSSKKLMRELQTLVTSDNLFNLKCCETVCFFETFHIWSKLIIQLLFSPTVYIIQALLGVHNCALHVRKYNIFFTFQSWSSHDNGLRQIWHRFKALPRHCSILCPFWLPGEKNWLYFNVSQKR